MPQGKTSVRRARVALRWMRRAVVNARSYILIVVSGAFVFATFIVRDELREHQKDLSTQIERAQTAYATRNDIRELLEHLDNLPGEPRPATPSDFGLPRANASYVVEQATGELGSKGYAITARYRQFQLVDALRRQLPDNPSLEREARRAAMLSDDVVATFRKAGDLLFPLQARSGTDPVADSQQSVILRTFYSLRAKDSDASTALGDYTSHVLRVAEEDEANVSYRLKVLDWLSAGLFTVAWALGIASRFISKEEDGPVGAAE